MRSLESLIESQDFAASDPPPAAAPRRLQNIRHGHVLIADDDRRDVELMRVYLQMDGFQRLHIAESTAEVLPLASQLRPDLLLLDIGAPQHRSLEILRAIRNHTELGETPVVILVANLTGDKKLEVLRYGATDLLPKPVHHAELLARTRNVLSARMYERRLRQHSERLRDAVRQRTAQLEASRREVIRCLARAAEFRDDDTGHHIMRVGRYARLIGEELGLSAEANDVLELAAQLHDVGKIGIPDSILLKAGELTAQEYDVIQKHCGFGKKIIEGTTVRDLSADDRKQMRAHARLGARIMDMGQSPFLAVAKSVALTHHERWDGSGYPVGLAGEDIPLEGRITAVADVFDALSSKRPYKPAFPLERCFQILEEGRGSQFDPAVVDAFFVRRDDVVRIQIEYADVD